ncbi:MAG: CAP domain-containing protein [Actinomycetes bacterium]
MVTAALLLVTSAPAHASSAGEFVSDTNSARASHGLSGLSVSSDLTSVAQRHAASMARSGTLYHNPSLESDVCCWRAIGENVGEGPSESQVQSAFMNSAPHRDNILSSAYTQIGVGVATDSHGTLWVDEVFREPTGSSGSHHVSTTHTYHHPTRTTSTSHTRPTVVTPRRPVHRVNIFAVLARRMHQAAARRGHPGDPVAAAFGITRVIAQLQA